MTRTLWLLTLIPLLLTGCAAPTTPASTAAPSPRPPTATLTPAPTPTITPTPTPDPGPSSEALLPRLATVENEKWGVNGDGEMLAVSASDVVRDFERTHGWGKDPATGEWLVDERGNRVLVSREEAEAQGVEFVALAPETAQVEVADKGMWEVVGSELRYGDEVVGRVELNSETGEWGLRFRAQDGTEVWASFEALEIGVKKVDDGLDSRGRLRNERVVTTVAVMEQAPEGLEGKWARYVLVEGEWYEVPEPEAALRVWQAVKDGQGLREALQAERARLPENWRDLPTVERAALEEYLRQQAEVMHKLEPYWEEAHEGNYYLTASYFLPYSEQVGSEGEPFASAASVRMSGSLGGELNLWARRVMEDGEDKFVMITVPAYLSIQGGKGEAHFVVWNVAANPEAQDEMLAARPGLQEDGGLTFDELWRRYVRGELNSLFVDFPTMWIGGEATPEAVARAKEMGFGELMAEMERLNGLAPRGVVYEDEGGVERVIPAGMYWYDSRLYSWELVRLKSGLVVRIKIGDDVLEFHLNEGSYRRYMEFSSEQAFPGTVIGFGE